MVQSCPEIRQNGIIWEVCLGFPVYALKQKFSGHTPDLRLAVRRAHRVFHLGLADTWTGQPACRNSQPSGNPQRPAAADGSPRLGVLRRPSGRNHSGSADRFGSIGHFPRFN